MAGEGKKSVLMVCLGNICRSPIAEAVFIDCLRKRGKEAEWHVDSSAIIGYHTGKGPDSRAMGALKKYGIKDYQHRARVTTLDDVRHFDYIFGMDDSNMSDLEDIASQVPQPERRAQLLMLGKQDPRGKPEVPDPYYESGSAQFDEVLKQCVKCCDAFLDKVYQ
ncbi:hypothetical protein L5515_012650 [Caenorhabditis briggsae]|uniref:Phosphotyrosine protein phosphatase I domain-containing protein n=1 Tax=Caenorhabditis briggsae TaxID=6238 RepID=A0AAE9EXP2_CAEBR|nr:hypothetical protein L3Y34_005562 [Caenorhabditis briggsae]UMM30995.1 hypothetical protein L5515_012650 [Caenorhabditis briggsae]